MVTLPELTTYSASEYANAETISSAIRHYLQLQSKTPNSPTDMLRKQRNDAWLKAAFAVISHRQSPEDVCRQWSIDTVKLLQSAWNQCALNEENVALIAMGKLGAMELNLSSDIDIFFISRESPQRTLARKVRQFIKMISSPTEYGYGHRIDLSIRPGGNNSPVISSIEQMYNHYGYHGETWERSALIRHNPILGTTELLAECSSFLTKFAYRRHLDLNLFNDLSLMRDRIRHYRTAEKAINLKFHPGGIRELELLVHALQLIHGGRHPSVQTRSTSEALAQLTTKNLLDKDSAQLLHTAYWFYRDLENRIQLIDDQHTYDMPEQTSAFITQDMKETFVSYSLQVDQLIDTLLKPYKQHSVTFISNEDLESAFTRLNIADSAQHKSWENLLHTEARSKTKDRDELQKRQFLKRFVESLDSCNVDNELALVHLEKFITSVKAKTSLFTLFNSYDDLLHELVWIFSCSPFISSILIHRPELMDSFLLKSVEIDHSSEEALYASLQDHKLLSEVISASHFLRKRNIENLTNTLSITTDTIVNHLLDALSKRFQEKIDILTLGKWAGQQMGLRSDLDFVFLKNSSGSFEKQAKLARRFISFLQSPTSGQTLYSIDLRLRPSGNAGPLMSTTEEIKNYLDEKSAAWERQAYLMNRRLSDNTTLPLFAARSLTPEDKTSLRDIQKQLLNANEEITILKKSHGGLLHTELTLQAACLELQIFPRQPTLSSLCHALEGKTPPMNCQAVLANYMILRTYQQLFLLVGGVSGMEVHETTPEVIKACKIMQSSPKVVVTQLKNVLKQQRDLLNNLDPLSSEHKLVL